MANVSITFSGIHDTVDNLNYRQGTIKFKAVQAIRSFYTSEQSIDDLNGIDTDTLIQLIWDVGNDPAKIRSKRRNFSSLRSSINSDLQKLAKKDLNPENLIISEANIFDMTEEAKTSLLNSFTDAVKTGDIDIASATDILKAITDFLHEMDITATKDESVDIINEIKKVLERLGGGILEDETVDALEIDEEEAGDGEEVELEDDEDLEPIELDEDEDIEEIDADEDIEEIGLDEDEDLEDVELDEDEDIETVELDDEDILDEDILDEADLTDEEIVDDHIEDIELDEDDELEEVELDEDQDVEDIELDEDQDIEDAGDEDVEEVELDDDEDLEQIELDEDEDLEDVELDEDEDIETVELDDEDILDEDVPDEADLTDEEIVDDETEDIELEEDEALEDVELDEDQDIEDAGDEDVEEVELEDDEDLEQIELDEDEDLEVLDADEDIEEIDELDEDELAALEEFRKARELAEQFDDTLGEREKKFNAYIKIPKGIYTIGTKKSHKASLDLQPFDMPLVYMGKYPVTNALFEIFIEQTGYLTTAEKRGYGTVFQARYKKNGNTASWHLQAGSSTVKGASWHSPQGPGSSLHKKRNHPVVQVSVEDAAAYAAWIGRRLPTEAEWEAAARTDLGLQYPWGSQFDIAALNIEKSGICDTCAVDTYDSYANEFGMADTLGNVMEWTADSEYPALITRKKEKFSIAKGGAWNATESITIGSRGLYRQGFTANTIGFRCISELFQ